MIFYAREEELALLGAMLRGSAERARPTYACGVGGEMPERYFIRKLREGGAYTRVGQYWDRKGGNDAGRKGWDKRRD